MGAISPTPRPLTCRRQVVASHLAVTLLIATSGFAAEAEVAAASASASAAMGPAATPLDLAGVLQRAADNSPEIRAARAAWQAVLLRAPMAEKLPDGVAAVGIPILPVETRMGPQRLKLSVQQAFPWPGRLTRGGDAVRAEATRMLRVNDAVALRVLRDVRVPWVGRALAARLGEIVALQRRLLIEVEPSVRARFSIGKASFEDLQRLRLAIGELDDRGASLQALGARLDAEVRVAAGLPMGSELAAAGLDDDDASDAPLPAEATLQRHLAENPELAAAAAAIAAGKAQLAVAEAADWPDLMFGIDWTLVGAARMPNVADSGTDALAAMVGVKVPLDRSAYAAAEDSARASIRAGEARREALQRQLEGRLAALYIRLAEAHRQHRLYAEDLVPRAESALQSATTSFSVGRASFNDLIELQRRLLAFQMRLAEARAETVRATADLELLLGRSLRDLAGEAQVVTGSAAAATLTPAATAPAVTPTPDAPAPGVPTPGRAR